MGLNFSRNRSIENRPGIAGPSSPYAQLEGSGTSRDEQDAGSCSMFTRCCAAIFRTKARKRRRSEEGNSPRPHSKIIRLDVATEIDQSYLDYQDAESQTCIPSQTASTQTISTEEPTSSKDKAVSEAESIKTGDHQWLDYPFLYDDLSIKQLQVSKIMLIMRGLPGSGKSFLVKQIKLKYPQSVSVSADDYFMVDGQYKFQAKLLKEAHEFSQSTCEYHCRENKSVIIVDNTNVKRWEMSNYLVLAEKYRYTVVLVEPQTPWKFDATHLAARNSHGVDMKVLQKRLKEYQTIIPRYLGFFLNRGDSISLLEHSYGLLYRALQASKEFYEDFSKFSGCDTLENMLYFYNRNNCMGLSKYLLHLTTKFFRFAKKDKESTDLSKYEQYFGMTSRLYIAGFSVTNKTFGAKIVLDNQQLGLWEQNDKEIDVSSVPVGPGNGCANVPVPVIQDTWNQEDDLETNMYSSLVTRLDKVTNEEMNSVHGRRAHLTLGTSGECKPVQTGLDTIKCMQLLHNQNGYQIFKLPSGPGLLEASLMKLGADCWFILLDRYMTVNAMFTGSY